MAILKPALPGSFWFTALFGAALLAPLTQLGPREIPLVPNVAVQPAAPDLERLRERIEMALEETGTPGAAVTLVENGRVIWTAAFGKADVERDVPVTADTPFRVGSITKTFVALAVMQLVEAGRLRLDQPVRELAPELAIDNPWEKTHPLLVAHLLEHTAGFDDWHLCEYAEPNAGSLKRGLEFNPRSRRLRWPPGAHYSYSNSGPPVAAYLVEKITGQPFDGYLQRQVLAPLDMPHASLLPTEGLARGYRNDRLAPVDYWHILMRPAGALNASIKDLGNLVEMLTKDGTFRGNRFLTPASIERMKTPTTSQAARGGLRFGYGIGLYASLIRGRMVHGHDGGLMGYLSSMAFKSRSGYAVVVNRAGEGLAKVDQIMRGELAKLDAPPAQTVRRLSREQAARYAGTYRYSTPRSSLTGFLTRLVTIAIAAEDDRVYLIQGRDRIELLPAGDNLFRVDGVADPILAFVPQPGGGMDLETGYLTFSRANIWGVRFERLVLDLFGWLWFPALSSCLRLVFRGLFRNQHRGTIAWMMPLMPVLACIAMLAWWVPFFKAGEDLIPRYGRVTLYSAFHFTMSLGFAAFTLWSFLHLKREWERRDVLEPYWPVACAALYQSILLMYFLAHGLIGLMTWWY